jgi:hypothetical protein
MLMKPHAQRVAKTRAGAEVLMEFPLDSNAAM